MKRTVITCDKCPERLQTVAHATLELKSSKHATALAIDVCKHHYDEIREGFAQHVPAKNVQLVSSRQQTMDAKIWADRESKIIGALKDYIDPINHKNLSVLINMERGLVGETMRRLHSRNVVVRISNGPGTKWKLNAPTNAVPLLPKNA